MSTGTLVDVVMPQMGVSVSEGTIVTLAQAGRRDRRRRTRRSSRSRPTRSTPRCPSPASGVVARSSSPRARPSTSGTRIAVIDTGGGGAGRAAAGHRPRPRPRPRPAPRRRRRRRRASADAPHFRRCPSSAPPAAAGARARRRARTARRATCARSCRPSSRAWWPSTALDIAAIPGTGRGGRVTKKDVEQHLAGGAPARCGCARRRPGSGRGSAAAAPPPRPCRRRRRPPAAGARGPSPATRIAEPMSTIRKVIARNMRAVGRHGGARLDVLRGRHDRAAWTVRAAVNTELHGDLRRQGLIPAVHHARRRRGDPALAVGQRRDARRPDRRQALRQPRHRRRDRRRARASSSRSSTTPRSSTCSASRAR